VKLKAALDLLHSKMIVMPKMLLRNAMVKKLQEDASMWNGRKIAVDFQELQDLREEIEM